MSKRAKIEKLYVVVSSIGTIVGCGIDAPSACRVAGAHIEGTIDFPSPVESTAG